MYYLTIDGTGTQIANLWKRKPVYFDDEGAWGRSGGSLTNSTSLGWPGLKYIALNLGLEPGPAGIMEVDIEVKSAAAPADSTAGQ